MFNHSVFSHSIQTMSCKLLLNLVDCIRLRGDSDNQSTTSRELLMRMLEVFVLKFKTIAKQQLPVLNRNNWSVLLLLSFPLFSVFML